MTFTAKEDYGLRAALALARAWEIAADSTSKQTLQARDIAQAQQIPEPFLEQVLATLRRAGIVNAIRGASGGYELARPPEMVTAADVLRALSGPLIPCKLVDDHHTGNTSEGVAIRHNVWCAIERSLNATLEHLTLRCLLDEMRIASTTDAFAMHI